MASLDILTRSQTTMRAAHHPRYGSPLVVSIGTRAKPQPGPGEVLVSVRSALVSIGDVHVIAGKPYLVRLTPFGGFPRPRRPVPGLTFAGEVVEVGPGVVGCEPGSAVFGQAAGAFAEYTLARPEHLAAVPAGATAEQAATLAWAVTPHKGLLDIGRLRRGERVLIHGASGGVGTWAVQIAKSQGAEVTAVCSGRNYELVRSLGADHVVDYTRADFLATDRRYDLIFDAIGDRPLGACVRALGSGGRYVCCSGRGDVVFGPLGRMFAMAVQGPLRRVPMRFVLATQASTEDLTQIAELFASGAAAPVIERTYSLDELPQALAHVATHRTRGQVVVRIGAG